MTDPRAVEDRLADVLREDAERLRPAPVLPPDVHPRVRRRVARNAAVAVLSVTVLFAGAVAGVRSIERGTTPPVGSAPVCTWTAVPAPSRDAEGLDTYLRSVAATGSNEALSVGISRRPGEGGRALPELQRWNGVEWSELEPPPLPDYGEGPDLESVSASGPGDAWAVGRTATERGGVPLALHWDGDAWRQVAFPGNSQPEAHLYGVSAVAADDAWGVGGWARPGALTGGPLVAHWDGNEWTATDLPTSDRPEGEGAHHYDALYGVDATPGDAWAVGARFDVPQTFSRTLVEHWDGASWEVVPSPNVEPTDSKHGLGNSLSAVATISPDDVWAVGAVESGGDGTDRPPSARPLTMHWDGSTWQIVDVPGVEGGGLLGIAALSARDVWAVGSASTGGGPASTPLIVHWDGSSWERVPSPVAGTAQLTSVAGIPGGGLWAVGLDGPGSPGRSLALRCD